MKAKASKPKASKEKVTNKNPPKTSSEGQTTKGDSISTDVKGVTDYGEAKRKFASESRP